MFARPYCIFPVEPNIEVNDKPKSTVLDLLSSCGIVVYKFVRKTREHGRPWALGISKPGGFTRTGWEFGGRGGGPKEGKQTA
jgi:hypothetical protein